MTYPFILFEGVDGAGKSVVSSKVASSINATYIESPVEPFRCIRNAVDSRMTDPGRFLFYLASNYELSEHIKQCRIDNKVVCARYIHSTLIGYASRNNVSIDELYTNSLIEMDKIVKPDLTIFLYVNKEAQHTRIKNRCPHLNSAIDQMSLENEQYQQQLSDNYLSVSKKEDWHLIDTSHIDIDEVVRRCIEQIKCL